jgi:hypothetical protein
MNAKTDQRPIKMVNIFVPTEVYYTYSHWPTKDIDGVTFLSVVKEHPSNKTQTIHFMRKDSLKVQK